MGGFVSRPAGSSEEVAVKPPVIRADDVSGELNHASKSASFDPSVSVVRSDASQPSQAPKQKQQNNGTSLRMNSRTSSNEQPLNDVAFAEEEEMQRAIEASLREGSGDFRPVCPRVGSSASGGPSHSGTAGGATGSARAGAADTSAVTLTNSLALGLGECSEGGIARKEEMSKAPRSHSRPQDGAFKAAHLGLGGDYAWVDNSDFHSPGASQARRDERPAGRSASCGSRPAAKYNSNGMRSGIVSLPRITQQLPVEQQVMVKDLHEKIKETISRPGTREEAVRARALGKNASADVLRVMEDLSLDDPLCRGPLQPRHDRDINHNERFNENFHSCRARDTRPGGGAAGYAAYPNSGLLRARSVPNIHGPQAVGAGNFSPSSGVRRLRG